MQRCTPSSKANGKGAREQRAAAAGREAGRPEQGEEQKWPRMAVPGRGAGHARSRGSRRGGSSGAAAMASPTAEWLSPMVSALLLCGRRLRLGPPRGGHVDPGGAEVQGRGRSGGGAEEGAEE